MGAVSYTHLDVYKRQVLIPMETADREDELRLSIKTDSEL